MPIFDRLTGDRPPGGLHFKLLYEPSSRRVLLVCPTQAHAGVDVWSFDGGRWSRVVENIFRGSAHAHDGDDADDVRIAAVVAWIDPATEHAVIGAIVATGLLTTTLSDTSNVKHRAFDFGEHAFFPRVHSLWHPARDAAVIVVCRDNDAMILQVGADAIETVEAEVPHLIDISVVEDAGAALAHDVEGNLYVLTDEGLFEYGEPERGLNGLAWSTELDTVVSLKPTGDDGMVLTKWTEEGFVEVEPRVTSPTYRSGGQLLVTPAGSGAPAAGGGEQIIYFGGQDFARGGDLADSALFTTPGGHELVSDAASEPPLGSYTTLLTMGTQLVLANHSTMTLHAWDGERWPTLRKAPEGPFFDQRFVNFATDGDALFFLDAKGLWRDGELVAGDEGGPGAHYTHRVALAWDPPTKRLVVFGGDDCNSTWVWDQKGFAELRPPRPPPHGIGMMVSTPHGAHLLVDHTLWRFQADAWQCVAVDVPGFFLLYDARRDRFLVGGDERGRAVLSVLDDSGVATPAAELPKGLRFGSPSTHRLEAAIDPGRDVLVIAAEKGGSWKLPLAAIENDARGIPRTTIAAPPTRHATPPPEWTRSAHRLVAAGDAVAPDLEGLVAIVKTDAGTIAITRDTAPDYASLEWGIGTSDHHACFIDHDEELVVVGGGGGAAKRLARTAFRDIDPEHVTEVDTPPGRADAFAYGSKVGGYPRYVQDDPTTKWTGPPLKFLVQLGSDMVPVGDVGKLYVWVTEEPTPRLLVLSQSH